jgi:hypothetical protein
MDNNKNNFNCPICTNIIIRPRLYDCGHSVCQNCMVHIDNETNKLYENNTEAPLYKCPICRKTTHKPWFYRTRNLFLTDIVDKTFENDEEYLERNKNHNHNPMNNIPENQNLSLLCRRARNLKLSELYDYIVPLIYEACLQGKEKITITDRTPELHNYCKDLSTKLFDNYGIYKIESNNNIFEIFIVDDINRITRNGNKKYVNSNYNSNSDNSDNEETYLYNQEIYQDNSEDEDILQPI